MFRKKTIYILKLIAKKWHLSTHLLLFLYFSTSSIYAQESLTSKELMTMSLADLLKVKVYTVSKTPERLQDAASSIYVITNEDIKNSGATNLHELLRTVPGYWGIQTEYGVTSPNMRHTPSDDAYLTGSVLYLLDGTPLQEQMNSSINLINFDIPLEEIERIEIIKGSGGVIYGINSATGIVSIFTKSPEKHAGLSVKAEGAYPGYISTSVRGGIKLTDKFSISGYGKVRFFEGYGLFDEFDGDSVTVPLPNEERDTTITNTLTDNFQRQVMISAGINSIYQINRKSKLSLNTHFNTNQKGHYSNYLTRESGYKTDIKVHNQIDTKRFTGNIKFEHIINTGHSFFFRSSVNYENNFERFGGGYRVNNSIIDFEFQDNFKIGNRHKISTGLNYRFVNFDVNSINDSHTIAYHDPQANESIKGLFLQDVFSIVDQKIDLIIGSKIENYSLVNDKFYLSPMAKLSVRPTEKLTFWGGFTQSYTTRGMNQTHIDYTLYSAPTHSFFYAQAIQQGFTEQQADQYAKGQEEIYPDYYNVKVKNGNETTPSKFQTFELGMRSFISEKIYFETNLFYSILSDIVAGSEGPIEIASPTLTDKSLYADYVLFGNYVEGVNYGAESILKYHPANFLTLEFSHSFLHTNFRYQENPDFDINKLDDDLLNRNVDKEKNITQVPKHTFRLKGYLTIAKRNSISIHTIYATTFRTQEEYIYEKQRYNDVIGRLAPGTLVAKDRDRFIIDLKIERSFYDKKISIYFFGNDIFNKGILAQTAILQEVTLSKIGGMYGVGINYKIK